MAGNEWMGYERTGHITRFKKSKVGKATVKYAKRAGEKIKQRAKEGFQDWRETPAQPARMIPRAAAKPSGLLGRRDHVGFVSLHGDADPYGSETDYLGDADLYAGNEITSSGAFFFGKKRKR